ncbi:ABC transporter ATP-binding protein [Alkaliphilus hydrothermalis]|uniref:ABC transport system ATP-binding protein n=1 Tax=Alkaliphilus hydrothermalis TaxID=1482730 RepID=A0ABS2NT09_9FIRM|nr:ABC transporter ATP-binding protein [Alkaliphilus hydrothermalis]MBM7616099.1 putative ABC transport system ATP-binding protein [Alkaliphilus hydrothermalis]
MFQLNNLKYKSILNIDYLTIPQGKVTCIIGESGSGKTTLLRLLNKMISPDGGTIHHNGTPLQEMDSVELRRRVVMLPQAPAIFPGTVKDNLLIGLKFSEKPLVSDDQLNQTLQMVSLKKELDQKADKLSGGEKQRLALGRVILMEPDIFLLDEPSSALDESTEDLIIKKLVDYCTEKSKSLIMVTHSKRIATTFGEHIIEIKNGEIV